MLRSALAISLLTSGAIAAIVLVGLDGWHYYLTPLRVRGYAPQHALLRPSGPAGQLFGIAGGLLMLVPFLYTIRKRLRRLRAAGNIKALLEIHIFCGIVGPVLITFHTSFKFNGIISAAYWSMVIVVLSGFIGRYLYVRIPRSLRGTELSRNELQARAEELKASLALTVSPAMLARVAAIEAQVVPQSPDELSWLGLMFGEINMHWKLWTFRRAVARTRGDAPWLDDAVALMAERAKVLRSVAYLQRTKRLFDLWHVFHLPLVFVMLVIGLLHVAIVTYLGYAGFSR
jgi:hypothetical protein